MEIKIMFIIEQYLGDGIWSIVNGQVYRDKQYAEDLKNKLITEAKKIYRIKRLQVV